MPRSVVYFAGGPCDKQTLWLNYPDKPPARLPCRGTMYELYPAGSGALVYATPQWIANYNAPEATRGQRDVFRAWHRLMHGLARRTVGERRRVIGARQRIRRAVR